MCELDFILTVSVQMCIQKVGVFVLLILNKECHFPHDCCIQIDLNYIMFVFDSDQ